MTGQRPTTLWDSSSDWAEYEVSLKIWSPQILAQMFALEADSEGGSLQTYEVKDSGLKFSG